MKRSSTDLRLELDRVIRSSFGLTISRSFVFERVLEVAGRLCWNPADIGLTRVHTIAGEQFRTRKGAERFAADSGRSDEEITFAFDWLEPMAEMQGVERETYLQSVYWPRREQMTNILVDTALQSHPVDASELIQALLGIESDCFEFMVCKTNNTIRALTGQPDIVFVDQSEKNVVLCEIKIGATQARYSLDQHLKYLTLARLLRADELFPDANIHVLLFAADPMFLVTAPELEVLDPVVDPGFCVRFNYEHFDPRAGEFGNEGDVDELLESRLRRAGLNEAAIPLADTRGRVIHLADWQRVLKTCNEGGLREHLSALAPFLLGRKQWSAVSH
jgi:hypothetical protein